MGNKYYWLKLQKDFFKRHDIKIIESMDNGEKYVLFYLKLVCESITHNGELRFSELVPYNESMLATVTNTDIDVVRSAMKLLTELGMIEILDDATIYMTECEKMLGKDDSYERVKKHRAKKKLELLEDETNDNVTDTFPSFSVSKSVSISKSNSNTISIRDIKNIIPPPLDLVYEYCLERKNNVDAEQFYDFYQAKGWKVGKEKMKDWQACVRTWEKREQSAKVKNKPINWFEVE